MADSYLSDIDSALSAAPPPATQSSTQKSPDPFAADIDQALAASPTPSAQLDTRPAAPLSAPAQMGEGVIDALTAGAQGTRPSVRGMPSYGYPDYTPAPAQDQWTFAETGQVPNQKTQVALRDPDTNQYKIYQRNPAMEEGAAPALGRLLAYGTPEAGIPRVATPAVPTAAQNLAQDFARTGVAPNVPVLAQGPTSGYAASIMSKLPGFAGPIVRGSQNMVGQTGEAADRMAAGLGVAENPEQAGAVLQGGVENFAKRAAPAGMSASDIIASPTRASSFAAKSNALYDRFWSQMDPNAQIPLDNTLAALHGPTDRFPTIPGLGQQITNPKLASLYQTVAPKVTTTPSVVSSILDQSGNPIITQAAQKIQSGGSLTVPELKEFRSYIGRALGDPVLVPDIPRADLSRVYAGMSQDLEGAAQAQGPQASRAFEAANSYYRAGQQRIDQLEPLLNGSPEQSFAAINRAAGQGPAANAGLLRSLQRSLPDQDWGNVGAAVLRKLGTPTAGAKDVVHGGDFSPASFVTNWNKLSDAAKDTLFGAQGTDQRDSMEALTRVAGAQKNMTRFANPSGTGHMGATVAELGVGATAFENREMLQQHPIMTTLALAGGYAAPRMLMSPTVAKWLYAMPATINRAPTATAGIQRALGGLDAAARGDPVLAQTAAQLRNSLAPAANDQAPSAPPQAR